MASQTRVQLANPDRYKTSYIRYDNFCCDCYLNFYQGNIAQAFRAAYYAMYTLADTYLILSNSNNHQATSSHFTAIRDIKSIIDVNNQYDLCGIFNYRKIADYDFKDTNGLDYLTVFDVNSQQNLNILENYFENIFYITEDLLDKISKMPNASQILQPITGRTPDALLVDFIDYGKLDLVKLAEDQLQQPEETTSSDSDTNGSNIDKLGAVDWNIFNNKHQQS